MSADWKISGAPNQISHVASLRSEARKAHGTRSFAYKFYIDIWSLIYICDFPWFHLKLMWLQREQQKSTKHFFFDFSLFDVPWKLSKINLDIDRWASLTNQQFAFQFTFWSCKCKLFPIILPASSSTKEIFIVKYDLAKIARAEMKLYLGVMKWIIRVITMIPYTILMSLLVNFPLLPF